MASAELLAKASLAAMARTTNDGIKTRCVAQQILFSLSFFLTFGFS
jgi:hypothetical protein